MTHLMNMSVSAFGWSVEPGFLADVRVEIHHSELFGDTLRVKLTFKTGREALIEGELKDGIGRGVYDAIHREIMTPTKEVIDAEDLERRGPGDP